MDQKELRELENRCIQECAPWCSARCPVHVDVRAMNAAIENGDLKHAAEVFRKKVPFPGVISRVCDHPCETVCKRAAVDEPISIRNLERAAMTWSPAWEGRFTTLPGRGKRIALVGAGLSGMTAAIDLAKKGFEIVLFEATDKLGGTLRDYPENELPRDVLEHDLGIFDHAPIEIRLGSILGRDVTLPGLEEEFDAIYLGAGRDFLLPGELELDEEGGIKVDPVTFQTSRPHVFAGGSLISGSAPRSPIRSISDGRRAAISIDRYVQKVSLAASRENEGAYETRLYTSVEGIEPCPRFPLTDPATGYSIDDAIGEAGRCLQCECMECVKVCEYLASYKGYPRKYVRQIYNNLSIVAGHRQGNLMINSCSLCGLCKEVCPEDLHMGEVCKAAREIMVDEKRMPPSAHEFALRDMEFSTSDHFTLARHQPGMESSAFLFFPGCQLSALSPEEVKKTYAYLREQLDGGVGLMLRCCGAPADWSGRTGEFLQTFEEFESEWRSLGSPKLILACSTCLSIFANRLPREKIVSLWEILDEVGLPSVERTAPRITVSVHDPCTSRHEPQIHESVRNLLGKLGFEIEELELSREQTECCSFGGLMYFANRDLADKVIRRRIGETPETMLAYCAMCRDCFAREGKPTWHLLDLIFGEGGIEAAAMKGPDYSQRRENRARLKRSLLGELWSEKGPEPDDSEAVRLHISDRVRELMQRRMILVEDLQEVVRWAEKTGNRLVHCETGNFLAHYRPGTVTYWVEYSSAEDGYTIHNAYSHRMEIVEELKR